MELNSIFLTISNETANNNVTKQVNCEVKLVTSKSVFIYKEAKYTVVVTCSLASHSSLNTILRYVQTKKNSSYAVVVGSIQLSAFTATNITR